MNERCDACGATLDGERCLACGPRGPQLDHAARREVEARALWEKEQWRGGAMINKAHDRPKELRRPTVEIPETPMHPAEGARDETARALKEAEAVARRRGKTRAARRQ